MVKPGLALFLISLTDNQISDDFIGTPPHYLIVSRIGLILPASDDSHKMTGEFLYPLLLFIIRPYSRQQ